MVQKLVLGLSRILYPLPPYPRLPVETYVPYVQAPMLMVMRIVSGFER